MWACVCLCVCLPEHSFNFKQTFVLFCVDTLVPNNRFKHGDRVLVDQSTGCLAGHLAKDFQDADLGFNESALLLCVCVCWPKNGVSVCVQLECR